MRITEYMKTATGWHQGREYYWFPGDPTHAPWSRASRQPCPGCGKQFTAMAQADHRCLGGTAKYPRIVNPRPDLKGRAGRPRKVKL